MAGVFPVCGEGVFPWRVEGVGHGCCHAIFQSSMIFTELDLLCPDLVAALLGLSLHTGLSPLGRIGVHPV